MATSPQRKSNCIDETGHRYGCLTVIESIRRPQDRKTMWRCLCGCGNEIICSGSDLRRGARTSCGKHCAAVKDEKGKVYGFLTVLERDPAPAITFPDKSIHWICQCSKCGSEVSISGRLLRNGEAKSCGCIKSIGEQAIAVALQQLNYYYKHEYTFADLISPYSNRKLRFDFAIFDASDAQTPIFLIEYQGAQHEVETSYFQQSLEYIKTCDAEKQKYSKQKNIPILYFTPIGKKVPSVEDIKEMIQEFREELTYEISN